MMNANETADKNLSHRKHDEIGVDSQNEFENCVEATFAEIRD